MSSFDDFLSEGCGSKGPVSQKGILFRFFTSVKKERDHDEGGLSTEYGAS